MAIPRISKEDLQARLESESANSPILIDARLKYPYEHSTVTLPSAIRMLPDNHDASGLSQDRDIVVYDSDPGELASVQLAASLIRQGFRALVLKGGINDWIAAKLPTDSKDAPVMAPPKAGALKG